MLAPLMLISSNDKHESAIAVRSRCSRFGRMDCTPCSRWLN